MTTTIWALPPDIVISTRIDNHIGTLSKESPIGEIISFFQYALIKCVSLDKVIFRVECLIYYSERNVEEFRNPAEQDKNYIGYLVRHSGLGQGLA